MVSQTNLTRHNYAEMLSSQRLTHREMLSMRKTEQVCDAIKVLLFCCRVRRILAALFYRF